MTTGQLVEFDAESGTWIVIASSGLPTTPLTPGISLTATTQRGSRPGPEPADVPDARGRDAGRR